MAEVSGLQRGVDGSNQPCPIRAAFIGTRRLEEVSDLAHAVYLDAVELAVGKGEIVRTGAAPGADQIAAMRSLRLGGRVELVLPWHNYEEKWVTEVCEEFFTRVELIVYDYEKHIDWRESVKAYHPAPWALKPYAWKLHARNYGIIEPCEYVVALPGPDRKGGTEQGIRIAKALGKRCVVLASRDRNSGVVSVEGPPDPARVAGWVPFQLDCTVREG